MYFRCQHSFIRLLVTVQCFSKFSFDYSSAHFEFDEFNLNNCCFLNNSLKFDQIKRRSPKSLSIDSILMDVHIVCTSTNEFQLINCKILLKVDKLIQEAMPCKK